MNEPKIDTQSEKKYPPLDIVAPVVFALVFIITLIYSRLEPNVEDVDMDFVIAHKDLPGYVLLDARAEEFYEGRAPFAGKDDHEVFFEGIPGGHIPGAINFPLMNLNVAAASAALAKVGVTKNKIIIIYCNTGSQSGRFADALVRRFNFSPSKLKNYRGGVRDWISRPENILLPEDHDGPYFSENYKKNRKD
ncbi:MAG: rhodanese-like domain-containing protein [Synergistales bacterium]|nr:rhodanese-like domain-containing protein [Synergistales bacterium]MDY6401155.1 rhodanese-like domain-containing protein [Synergistales bacterium]MDY6404748.1 rhodanese-like domain-containing protein [Synergistales bacterium]MDY6409954.1 rhodanese-like domain-containing protein [Synergistales bacterium]MDY6414506.1 rhodanese-like domain-containing protein [Synergistales bacterium]